MSADAALLARLEAVTARLEAFANGVGSRAPARGGGGGGDDKAAEGPSEKVLAYDSYYTSFVVPFIEAARKYKDTAKIGDLTETGFKAVRTFLDAASKCKKATGADLERFVKPLVETIGAADKGVDMKNQTFGFHTKAFAEGIVALQWVQATPPKSAVDAGIEASDFYNNKILTAAKNMTGDDQKNHRAFVSTFKAALAKLVEYIKDNHKAGVDWNPRGIAAKDYSGAAAAPGAAPSAPAAPEAPDAPAAPDAPSAPDAPAGDSSSGGSSGGSGMSAVFAAINAGSDAKSATEAFKLKKVDKSQMTHKNAALRSAPGLAPKEKAAPAEAKAAKKGGGGVQLGPQGPPRLALEKGTWFCENYGDGKEVLVIPDVQMKQAIYISRCKNMTISIPDKCKSIAVDKCERVRVIFKAVVSTCEVVNSARIWVDAQEMCPAFALDKSNGVSVIVQKAALDQPQSPEIVSSCISECNFVVPGPKEGDDPVEIPIPEQFCTKYDKAKKKISTECVTHGG